MIYRMKYSDLLEVKTIEDLNGRIAVYYVECSICNSYRRVSYSTGIIRAAILSHIYFDHNIKEGNVKENIIYKTLSVDLHDYLKLHDLILIDP